MWKAAKSSTRTKAKKETAMSAALMGVVGETLGLIQEKLFHGHFDASEREEIYGDAKELLFNNKIPPEESKLRAKSLDELESRYPELVSYLISGKLTSVRWC